MFGSPRTQKVVSLSSGVPWHQDVQMPEIPSGGVDHWQRTDNQAARQLVSRQGVGKTLHLSGKFLRIQSKVMDKELMIGQVPRSGTTVT